MKNRLIVKFIFMGILLVVGVTACNHNKPKLLQNEIKKVETPSKKQKIQNDKKEKQNFKVKLENFDPKTSTPIIIKYISNDKENYSIAKIKQDKKIESNIYNVEVNIPSIKNEITIFVPPVNKDGSTYETNEKELKSDKETELKHISKDKVTDEQINKILTDTRKAMENGCDELTIEQKNKLLEQQVNNTNKADVKKGKETKIAKKIKPTNEEKNRQK